MKDRQYFRSANKLNVAVNFLSGNAFPLSDEDIKVSFVANLWIVFVSLIKIAYTLTMVLGSFYFANLGAQETLKKSGPATAVCLELIILTVYLNLQRKELRNLISMYNAVLVDSDDLRKYVHDTVEPYKNGLKFYIVGCLLAVSAWSASPILLIFDNDNFTYTSFAAPAYLPGEPFGINTFIAGILLQIIGTCFINLAKLSIDVYVSYFIAILSAEYKYLRAQTAKALSQENSDADESLVIGALQKCIRHHCAVIEIGQKLAKLLELHVGATYITCIIKFCFLAFGVITFESANLEKATYLVYALACLIQVFLLCSCIQELLDESSSVTRDAFHENWYSRSIAVKKLFCGMAMSNKLECRLSAYRVVNLIVPTLATILSKSYSVCLLLLEVK